MPDGPTPMRRRGDKTVMLLPLAVETHILALVCYAIGVLIGWFAWRPRR